MIRSIPALPAIDGAPTHADPASEALTLLRRMANGPIASVLGDWVTAVDRGDATAAGEAYRTVFDHCAAVDDGALVGPTIGQARQVLAEVRCARVARERAAAAHEAKAVAAAMTLAQTTRPGRIRIFDVATLAVEDRVYRQGGANLPTRQPGQILVWGGKPDKAAEQAKIALARRNP